jgi:hypothetical protein
MTVGKERAVEILRGPDGEQVWLALMDYAQKLSRRYGWRVDKILPQAFSPGDVAKNTIIKLLEGERTWDEAKEPSLLNALKGMVRSEIGHLFDDYEASHVERIEHTLPDGTERTADRLAGSDPSPEEQVLVAEQVRIEMTALDLILEEVEGNCELEAVFLALYDSASSGEISVRTQLPVGRVYSLRRELERIAAKITPARVAREAKRRKNGQC